MIVSAASRAWACVLAGLGLFAADAALFRSRLYPSILEPDSSAGLFELILRREREAQARLPDNLVVTLGDSRFAYYPRVANELTPNTGLTFRSAGVAGSSPRLRYYMLRDLEPEARRYRAIVLGVNDFEDEDGPYDIAEEISDLHYAIARLRLTDTVEFARSFHKPSLVWRALRGSLFKGLIYQADLLAFLSHPKKRLDYVELCRHGYEEWTYNFVDSSRTMAGLEIDFGAGTLKAPSSLDRTQVDSARQFLLYAPSPQTGTHAAFRREWFGKIIDRYRGSRTRIIFLRLPRGPIPRPGYLVRKRSSTIHEFAFRPGVLLTRQEAFDELERPELFKDGLHLNHDGCTRFSAMLAHEIAGMLGPATFEQASR